MVLAAPPPISAPVCRTCGTAASDHDACPTCGMATVHQWDLEGHQRQVAAVSAATLLAVLGLAVWLAG